MLFTTNFVQALISEITRSLIIHPMRRLKYHSGHNDQYIYHINKISIPYQNIFILFYDVKYKILLIQIVKYQIVLIQIHMLNRYLV